MNIYEFIKNDHIKVKEILASLQNNLYDKKLFLKLAKEVIIHSEAEEKVFYSPLKKKSIELKLLVESGWEEHEQISHFLKQLNRMHPEDEGWEELISTTIKSLKAHIDKEETEMFSLAKLNLTNEEAESMVTLMKSQKHSLENEVENILNGNIVANIFHKMIDKVIEGKDAISKSVSKLADNEEKEIKSIMKSFKSDKNNNQKEGVKTESKKANKIKSVKSKAKKSSSTKNIDNPLSQAASKMRTGTLEERKEAAKLLGSKGGKKSHGGGRPAKEAKKEEFSERFEDYDNKNYNKIIASKHAHTHHGAKKGGHHDGHRTHK